VAIEVDSPNGRRVKKAICRYMDLDVHNMPVMLYLVKWETTSFHQKASASDVGDVVTTAHVTPCDLLPAHPKD
jgi:hypothetical protein